MTRVAVYTITRNKRELTEKSIKLLRRYAGVDFHHYVVDNGSGDGTAEWVQEDGGFRVTYVPGKNLGQNIAANIMLDEMGNNYDYVMRWDPDALPRSRRFLKKMVKASDFMSARGLAAVVSPNIGQLENPPEPITAVGDDIGQRYEMVEVLGGICRMHPSVFFDNWRFNKFGALGFGEALDAADHAQAMGMARVRLVDLHVDHAYGASGQAERYGFNWENREVGRYLGYGL